MQYLDFAVWQREWLSGEVLEAQLAYWRRQLASVPPLELPTDRPRPAVRTHNGTALPLVLLRPPGSASLKTFAQREGSTLFIVLLAAFKALLHHWTTQEDVAVGTLIANRRRPEVEGMIGFFANSLALRTDLSGDPTFRELLGREREVSLDAYAHQDVPFEKLVEELNPPRDMARTPVFQVMLILLNAPGGEAIELPGLEAAAGGDRQPHVEDGADPLPHRPAGRRRRLLEYNTDLFDARHPGAPDRPLSGLLATVIRRPGSAPLGAAAALRRRSGASSSSTGTPPRPTSPPSPSTAGSRSRVRQAPDAVAVEFEASRLTYGELDARANRLARHLRRPGGRARRSWSAWRWSARSRCWSGCSPSSRPAAPTCRSTRSTRRSGSPTCWRTRGCPCCSPRSA